MELKFTQHLTYARFRKADEKNDPDLIPHDNSDDEKEFERLYTPTKLNYVNRHSPNSISPTLRFTEKQVSNLSRVLIVL